jgi:hypothetical protein
VAREGCFAMWLALAHVPCGRKPQRIASLREICGSRRRPFRAGKTRRYELPLACAGRSGTEQPLSRQPVSCRRTCPFAATTHRQKPKQPTSRAQASPVSPSTMQLYIRSATRIPRLRSNGLGGDAPSASMLPSANTTCSWHRLRNSVDASLHLGRGGYSPTDQSRLCP